MQRTSAIVAISGMALFIGAVGLAAPAVANDNQPSAKATAKVGDINLVSGPTTAGESKGDWGTILSNRIRTPSQKDLVVTVSLEAGLYTQTLARSKGGNRDSATAEASVEVRVLVDGREAHPGKVVFSRRNQQLSATFQGLLDGALSVDPDTGAVIIDESLLRPEEVELIQDTMAANSFNFILEDVGTGVHVIEVQARINLGASADAGTALARATVGKGSMTVSVVRMIKDEDVTLDD